MASWPLYVKGPLDNGGLKITLGSSVSFLKSEDGRSRGIRMGSDAPDKLECSLLIPRSRLDYFKEYYARTLNMGLNWMAPTWLISLGYFSGFWVPTHSVRFLGYPKEVYGYYSAVECKAAFIIQLTSLVKADTTWPEAPSS